MEWQRLLGSGVEELRREAARLRRYLEGLDERGWAAQVGSSEWTRHDVVAHLASGEEYNEACFDGRLREVDVFDDDETYNRVHVERRRSRSDQSVLMEWLRRSRRAHALFASLPPETAIETSAGPYPVGLQAWHIANHYATHSDQLGVPVPVGERSARVRWRLRFCLYALRERAAPQRVTPTPVGVRISHDAGAVELSAQEFVDLVSGSGEELSDPLRGAVLGDLRGIV